MNDETWIALDGGTTHTRARIVRNGRIEETVKASAGVRDTPKSGDNPVKSAVRECVTQLLSLTKSSEASVRVVASGMLGSEAGLVNVPHVMAPATAADIAKGSILWSDPLLPSVPIRILPGVRTGAEANASNRWKALQAQDIMRGEETQVWGIRESLSETDPEAVSKPWLLIWPGSHTKLIAVMADGSISGSFTTIAGETYAALKTATLLKRSVPDTPVESVSHQLLESALMAVRQAGFLRAAFWTRVADVTDSLNEVSRGAWLSAVVTAEDVNSILRHEWMHEDRFPTVLVGGEAPRQSAYLSLLRTSIGEKVRKLDEAIVTSAAAIGAVRLASIAEAGNGE